MNTKRIGVLTSGGDAPGMNAAVRAVVRCAVSQGIECIGIRRGWNGLISGDFTPMTATSASHIITRGGTILYTARSQEFMEPEGRDKALATCKLLGLDGIVVIRRQDAEAVAEVAQKKKASEDKTFELMEADLDAYAESLKKRVADSQARIKTFMQDYYK